ncbi:hypothetical protein CG001_01535 [Mesoplasma coleopterae]|uniref:hypothetical protein n=1 Tax=Mesoplasma coleopterae TaxID=324078 RepID=UPI000D023DDB|nr:hypothetical protein [Mesoplasma coleopterae]AVN62326.1 hypothetical protein CG001_01535 [Mesoplasma coleopterae]
MNKFLITILGLAPEMITFSENLNNLVFKIESNSIEDAEDWNQEEIIIDFSFLIVDSNKNNAFFDLEIFKSKNNQICLKFITAEDIYKLEENISWIHKGFYIGELINDFIKDEQKVIFKNLIRGKSFWYDFEQPDYMISQLFMLVYKITFSKLLINYSDPDWFIGATSIGGFYIQNSEEEKEWNEKTKTRFGRHQLNLEYFKNNKSDEKNIIEKTFNNVFRSDIFVEYNIWYIWDKIFLKNINENNKFAII